MSQLAVVTPSHGPDAPLFIDLHRSVLEFTDTHAVHYVIVPPSDRALFSQFEGPRCRVLTESELLPPRFRRTPKPGWWVNLRHPWPPVRGWVLQQALKLAITALLEADNVLVVDSGVVFVRPVEVSRFMAGDRRSLYRLEDAVHEGMPRHLVWHQVARRLLGLPAAPSPPLPDYVSSLNVWEPAMVRALQRRITEITGQPWLDAVTHELHVSEFVLYGVYIDEITSVGGAQPPGESTLCHDYWGEEPLDTQAALAFVNELPAHAIGMMISSKSGTPAHIRQAALALRGCGRRPVAPEWSGERT